MIRGGFAGPGHSGAKYEDILKLGEAIDQELAIGKRYLWQLTKDERKALDLYRKQKGE